MQRKFGTILSVACGLALLVFLLLVLGGTAARTEAAVPGNLEQDGARSPQAGALNGASSRPLVVPLSTEPPTLDINLATDTTSHMVLDQLMEGLYRYRADGNIEPAGAVTHTMSPDGRVYTVTLRSDAVWSDGQGVTAQHYVDGVIRLLDPATGAGYAWLMYIIEGAWDFNTGVTTDTSSVGVTAVDTYTGACVGRARDAGYAAGLAHCLAHCRPDAFLSRADEFRGRYGAGLGRQVWCADRRRANALFPAAGSRLLSHLDLAGDRARDLCGGKGARES